jgi:hypothetical protein
LKAAETPRTKLPKPSAGPPTPRPEDVARHRAKALGHHFPVTLERIRRSAHVSPLLADLYRSKVEGLAAALQREDTRLEASEMLRGLIDSIVLTPEKGQLRIELKGNLAAMLTAAQQTKRSPETGDLLLPVQMVAGARNQHYLQLWRPAA